MLTSDLLRARVVKGEVRPQYLEADDAEQLARAATLVELFRAHVGRTRGELDDAMSEHVGEGTDFLLHRGLAKLLSDRCEFEVDAPCDPVVLRRRVFEIAAESHPAVGESSRRIVLERAATELGLAPEAAEASLYADLEREHVLRRFEPIDPSALLHRYNVALAQAVLLRASRLTLQIAPGDPARYRQLFRYIKFYRLMHTVHGSRHDGYTLTLDGPLSLFQLSSKYGLQMAEFLPALLLCEGWTLTADLVWSKERRDATFRLDPTRGLRSHYPDRGVYVTDEERFFVERFEAANTPWQLEKRPEILDLDGRGVLVPDFVMKHRDDGREALLEIVGFWRKAYLESRLALLREHAPRNLVLAVSTRLKSSEEALADMPGEVLFFRDVVPVKDVLERIDRIAIAPTPSEAPRAKRPPRKATKKSA
jgi:predicted nuclease of restriction endonuclease-like RecB superfamily